MGDIFDNEEQFLKTLHACRGAKKSGASRVGLFGSRARGTHTQGKSDIDIIVERPDAHPLGEYDFSDPDIKIVKVPENIEGTDLNSLALKKMKSSTRWVGRKKIT